MFGALVNLSFTPIETITSRTSQQEFKPPPGLESMYMAHTSLLKTFFFSDVWVVKQDQQENSQAREVVRRVERRLNGWLDGSAGPDRKLSPREEVL